MNGTTSYHLKYKKFLILIVCVGVQRAYLQVSAGEYGIQKEHWIYWCWSCSSESTNLGAGK